jgi:pteridine reductase
MKAPFFLAQAAAPWLRKSKGCIVNLVDVHGIRPKKDFPVYSMAKAANAMMIMSLARELGPDVRVNGVAPGAILWPEHEISDIDKARILSRVPLARHGEIEDIARTVRFLVTEADYITGQLISVDGGRTAQQ